MKAVILNEAGNTENLQFVQIEKPIVKSNEVLVKVVSLSINPVDVKARSYDGVLGWIFGAERPVILGWDISGQIVEIGNEVTNFKIGDEVFGMVNFFGNGKAPAAHLALKPSKISHQQAAASAMVGSTAYQALVAIAKIKKGDRVLIHGASGGVGHAAVQISKHFGAYVIGTSSSKNKDFVLSLGADEHLNYKTEKFLENIENIDIVIDTIQGETLLNSVDVVRSNGIIITLPSPEIAKEVTGKAEKKQVNIEFLMVASNSETITEIAQLMEKEAFTPFLHQVFSFEEIAKAHLEMETNRVVGKIVVDI